MRRSYAIVFVLAWTVSSGDGYDYASACARPYRAGRSRVQQIAPCDMTKQTYCTTPGSNYPWHAIRRFVRENQGLMRRMYGDERHIAVLKAELENFVEDDEEDDFKSASKFEEDILKTKMMYMKKTHERAMRVKPHFRPIQSTPPPKNKKYENDTLKVKPLDNKAEVKNITKDNNNQTNDDKGISYKTKLESIANVEINSLDPDVITLEAVIKQSIETNSVYSNQSTKTETPDGGDRNETIIERNLTTTEPTDDNTTITTTEQVDPTTTEANKDGWKPVHDTSTLPPTLLFSEHERLKNDKVETSTDDKKDDNEKKDAAKPVHHQEAIRPAVIKLEGANACGTREEITAPFWANNTGGELLALLNMYPFEQYIHMEHCVHERKQMYCREGCRCEQQYRLHRLLAYDPRNECRGIFADWFKFPACCVCKCYDVPLEIRARSPRILRPQYDEEVKRAIYDDVARDWYAQSYDVDDFL